MSARATNWAWKTPAKSKELLVLLALAKHADNAGVSKAPQPVLRDLTGLDRNGLRRELGALEAHGLIKTSVGYGRESSVYELQIGSTFKVLRGCETPPSSEVSEQYREGAELHPQGVESGTLWGVGNAPSEGAESHPQYQSSYKNKTPPTPPRGARRAKRISPRDTPEFRRFWDVYGHKQAIAKAEIAWSKALSRPGITADLLTERAEIYRRRLLTDGKWPQYAAHPATWLNQERYLDEQPSGPPDSVSDPEAQIREYWKRGDASAVAQLAGVVWIVPSQNPADSTPAEEFLLRQRREFIEKNRSAAIAALTRRSA